MIAIILFLISLAVSFSLVRYYHRYTCEFVEKTIKDLDDKWETNDDRLRKVIMQIERRITKLEGGRDL